MSVTVFCAVNQSATLSVTMSIPLSVTLCLSLCLVTVLPIVTMSVKKIRYIDFIYQTENPQLE